MTLQRKHGEWGEDLAATFLANAGYIILERNWRYKRAEIDIIARDQDILVFVEVKAKHSIFLGPPEDKVNWKKQKLLTDAGIAYMNTIGHEWEFRFDVISIHGSPGKLQEIIHLKDAFFPGLSMP